ncbi:MAG TPA: histidine kinase [Chloroflexia bacterium]
MLRHDPGAPPTTPLAGTDNPALAMMRLLLAASALLIIWISPTQPDRLVIPTYLTLGLYTLYSAVLGILTLRRDHLPAVVTQHVHWLDVAWYVVLISLSSGTSSIFFFGFFFAILTASFQCGFAPGLRVTVASAVLYGVVGFATADHAREFELNRALLRPVYLLVLGYLIAYWGGHEITAKRQLAFLKEVSTLSNPRFGVDRTIDLLLRRLQGFYGADAALLVMCDVGAGVHRLYQTAQGAAAAAGAAPIPAEVANMLLELPAAQPILYPGHALPWQRFTQRARRRLRRSGAGAAAPRHAELGAAVAALLEVDSFISVSLRNSGGTTGRIYLTARRRFADSDMHFLTQVAEHVSPVLENIRLVDRLAADAAEHERERIARNIHDSVIQPYIGMQMGLAAVRDKLAAGRGDVTADLDRLIALAGTGITDLRGFARKLPGEVAPEGSLLPAMRRFTDKFTDATGIAVALDVPADLYLHDRLAAEVFQIIAEGLSNVRRHTQAAHAAIHLQCRADQLHLCIENDGVDNAPAFMPRSITGRATALGGHVSVGHPTPDHTAVLVEIPL